MRGKGYFKPVFTAEQQRAIKEFLLICETAMARESSVYDGIRVEGAEEWMESIRLSVAERRKLIRWMHNFVTVTDKHLRRIGMIRWRAHK